ncbi:hypothetical protein QBC46DRAFT_436961, partial [Diplogelasinospora grovesii]
MAAIAPMDLVTRSDPATIPLKCSLCPKKPNFSDVSHLLTHISSKSHLAHRFKIELKSHTERDALDSLRQYDDWYERYGIRGLLADRMAAKEVKKWGKRGRPSNEGQSKPRTAIQHHELIKTEPGDYAESMPTIAHWATAPDPSLHSHGARQSYVDDSIYRTPSFRRTRSDYPVTPVNQMRTRNQRWSTTTTITEFADDDNDSGRLKGVRYPGMGLFDSASELQKRKRNQRKDESVLRQMEQTSSGIEPTEFVWTEDGEFQRTRDIYASPSIEGSPDRKFDEADNHKKKRTRRPTTVVAANRPRQTRSSARLARNKAKSALAKTFREETTPFDQDEHDISHMSTHSHGSMESYDVFRDDPELSLGRIYSSISSYELHRRQALQPLSSNIAMASPMSKSSKPNSLPYFHTRESGPSTFPSHPSIANPAYFQHQHGLGGGNINPLCVQTRSGFPYHSYAYPSYGNDPKTSTAGFQPINTMNQNLGNMPFNSFAPYTSDTPHDHSHTDFDI